MRVRLMKHISVLSLNNLDLVNVEFPFVVQMLVFSASGLQLVSIQVPLEVELVPLRKLLLGRGGLNVLLVPLQY